MTKAITQNGKTIKTTTTMNYKGYKIINDNSFYLGGQHAVRLESPSHTCWFDRLVDAVEYIRALSYCTCLKK